MKTSCGQKNTKYEAHIPAFDEFQTKEKINFTLFDFHRFFDGLISFRDLRNMGFNWNIQDGYLKKGNISVPVYQCSPSDYDCHNITINEDEILQTYLPFDVQTDGDYFIPETKINEHCYIPECITNISQKQGIIEIHNIGKEETYTNLMKPLKAYPLEQFELFHGKFEINSRQIDTQDIENLLRLDHLNDEEKNKLLKLCREFSRIFQYPDQPLSATTQTQHIIRTRDDEPVYTRSYRFPEIHKNEVKEQINKMLEQGIIRNSISPWSSPIWIVPKKADASGVQKWRIVIDYRKLNNKTIQERFPIPNIDELLDKLGKAQYFTTLDLASGFHQITMHKDSIEKTAFSTNHGHFEFLRMPFGLKNAPTTFQRMINEVLKECINQICLVYMDDVIIFSTTLDDHIINLRKVFKAFEKHNLKIQLDKSEFLKKETEFLGHIVNEEGIQPNPKKIDAILKFPIPKTHKQIKSFLGMLGFYRKFINNLSKIIKPMTLCLKKGKKVEHTGEFISAFETCKAILCNDPILIRPDFSKLFTVTTDASKFAIGAILSQDGKPVCYASRTLNPSETNYSVTEKELLAIVWAVKYFRPYLFGRHFKIKTDHRPLKWLDNLKEPNSKLIRWKLLLSEYDYEIDYIQGKENKVADALSRNPKLSENNETQSLLNETGDSDEVIKEFIETNVTTVHSAQEMPVLGLPYAEKPLNYYKNQMIIKISESSPVPLSIREKVFNNQRIFINLRRSHMEEDLEQFIANLQNNITYHLYFPDKEHERIFINQLQEKLIKINSKLLICSTKINDVTLDNDKEDKMNYHHVYKTGHRGITTTIDSLRRNYYWPNLDKDVTNYINNCNICQKAKYERSPNKFEFEKIPIGTKPFERIHMDTLSISKEKYLTIIDSFSKFAQAYPIPGVNAVNVLDGLLIFISHYGIPQVISCDNGIEFNNSSFLDFCKLHKIEIHFTTPKNPNSNSYVERFHSTLLEQIRIKIQQQAKEPLNTLVKYALLHYNNSIHSATDFTPFEIISGHFYYKDPFDIQEKDIVSKYVIDHKRKLKETYENLNKRFNTRKDEGLDKINEKRQTPITIKPDDVIYHKQQTRDKLAMRYTKLEPTAQTKNKIKTSTSKYSKHNIKRRKKK